MNKTTNNQKVTCPICDKEKEDRYVRRQVNIIVMRDQDLHIKEPFTETVASALQEYIDRLRLGNENPYSNNKNHSGRGAEEFISKNGCCVRVIAGFYDHE